jgi:DNA topoisomerase I
MKLIIVESPTKSKTIEKFLGSEYSVLSSFGHTRDLPKSEIGIDFENNLKPKYIIPLKARKTVRALKEKAQKAETIILASDEDREGEAIAWHLVQSLELDKTKKGNKKSKNYERIAFHEITKTAIEQALKNPREINQNLVDAQQARRILDRIVGYKLSPFLWKKVARNLSAGRVQSIVVKLVVDREKEIKDFRPIEYWSIEALLKKQDGAQVKINDVEFNSLLIKKNNKAISKFDIKDKKQADKILEDLRNSRYAIKKIEKKEIRRSPLPPFTTSTLQQEAWKRLRFPAKFTMGVAQKLYEKGFITYHRTDSLNLSQQSLFAVKKFIEKDFGKKYWAGFFRKYKAKSRAQEAHEAIRPTFPDKAPDGLKDKAKLDNNQNKLYDLIWRRFTASQMAQAIFDSTSVEIEATNIEKKSTNKYIFKVNGQMLKFNGFLKVYPIKFKENELPSLGEKEVLRLIKLSSLEHFTQPPARYNEATLIKALEENGIGRPSTYAPVLSTVQARNYIEKDEQKKFKPTEIGLIVNDMLVKHFPNIVDIKFTANMEEDLDKIASGEQKWVKVCETFYRPFEKNLAEKYKEVEKKDITDKPTNKKCPKCGAPLLIKLGKFGKFYACSKFPKCRYTESLKENSLKIKCPKCNKGNIVEKRTKKGKIFYGCDQFPKCDFALWDKPTGEKCPECGSLLIQKGKKIKCSNKNCLFEKNVTK